MTISVEGEEVAENFTVERTVVETRGSITMEETYLALQEFVEEYSDESLIRGRTYYNKPGMIGMENNPANIVVEGHSQKTLEGLLDLSKFIRVAEQTAKNLKLRVLKRGKPHSDFVSIDRDGCSYENPTYSAWISFVL